jgi:hypothetical protein
LTPRYAPDLPPHPAASLLSGHPVLAALSQLPTPLTATVLSAFVLGDHLGFIAWSGTVLLLAAFAVSYLREDRR